MVRNEERSMGSIQYKRHNKLLFVLMLTGAGFFSALFSQARAHLFYSPSCPHCVEIMAFLVDLESKYPELKIKKHNIDHIEAYKLFCDFEEKIPVKRNDPINLFIGDRVLSGKKEIIKEAEACAKTALTPYSFICYLCKPSFYLI